MNIKNYIGQTIGKLTILDIQQIKKSKNTYYKAKVFCAYCNGIGEVSLDGIRYNRTKSCGCQQYTHLQQRGLNNKKCKDLSNQKFGILTAIEIDNSKTSRVFWKCKCECGNIKSVASKHLTSKSVTSCGCAKSFIGNKSRSWRGCGEISSSYWERVHRGAVERNLDFSISIEEMWELFLNQKGKCALTGVDISLLKNDNDTQTASIDRIDSSMGYIIQNVHWVHKNINLMKRDFPMDVFLKTCKQIVEYNNL